MIEMERIKRRNLIHKLNEFEIHCITGNFPNLEFDLGVDEYQYCKEYELLKDLNTVMKSIVKHDYKEALQFQFACLTPLKEVPKNFTLIFYEMYSQLKSNYQYLFHPENTDCPYAKQLLLLLVAVSALQEFVRLNVCIPEPSDKVRYEICSNFFPESIFSEESIIDAFGKDGEGVLISVAHPKLLFLSLMLLFGNTFDKCLTHKWWLFRCMMIHQRMLSGIVVGLHQSIISLIAAQKQFEFLNDKKHLLAQVMYYVECAHISNYFHELNVARNYLLSAQNVLGMGIDFKIAFRNTMPTDNGVGFVTIKRNDNRYNGNVTVQKCTFPTNVFQVVVTDSATNINLIDSDGSNSNKLIPEEQLVLLAYCELLQNWPRSDPETEEDNPIHYCLFLQADSWSIGMKNIILKCKKYSSLHAKRYIACQQIKELLEFLEKNNLPFSSKQNFIYSANVPMSWELKRIYVHSLIRIGGTEEALKISEKCHFWEEAIFCYKKLQLVDRGTRVIEEEIAAKPSSVLWCYHGDLTGKADSYNVAWELSHFTNVRSRRSLGYYHLNEKDYDECCNYFEEALRLNHLQPDVLSSLGVTALINEELDEAISTFNKLLALDNNNFNAWKNLTCAYAKNDEMVLACRCMLKVQNFSREFETWETYILVCAKIGAFSDAVNGLQSYWQALCEKSIRLSMNDILTNALTELTNGIIAKGCRQLSTQLISIFEKLCYSNADLNIMNKDILDLLFKLQISKTKYSSLKMTRRVLKLQQKVLKNKVSTIRLDTLVSVLRYVIRYAQHADDYIKRCYIRKSVFKNREKKYIFDFLNLALENIEKVQRQVESLKLLRMVNELRDLVLKFTPAS